MVFVAHCFPDNEMPLTLDAMHYALKQKGPLTTSINPIDIFNYLLTLCTCEPFITIEHTKLYPVPPGSYNGATMLSTSSGALLNLLNGWHSMIEEALLYFHNGMPSVAVQSNTQTNRHCDA